MRNCLILLILIINLTTCSNDQKSFVNDRAAAPDSDVKEQNSAGSDTGKIIKEKGWTVPMPKDREKIRTNKIKMKSADGREFEVSTTDYGAKKWGFAYEEINPIKSDSKLSPLDEKMRSLVDGKMELNDLSQYEWNGKVFLYSILGHHMKTGGGYDSIMYKIIDEDGDGIFETLITDDANFLVPEWVIR